MKKDRLIKIFAVLIAVFALAVFTGNDDVKAADNGKLKLKTVHTYDEMTAYLEGDESFYSFTGSNQRTTTENNYVEDRDMEAFSESWTVDIEETGWLVFYEYNNYPGVYTESYYDDNTRGYKEYWDITGYRPNSGYGIGIIPQTFLYSNKLKTKPVGRTTEESTLITGKYYKYRDVERYYVQKGTYYLNYSGKKFDWNNVLLCAVFIPAKDIIDVKDIDYNADYSEATVTFKVASDDYSRVARTDQRVSSFAALGYVYKWADFSPYYFFEEDYNSGTGFSKVLSDGWTINKNGDYSIYYRIENGFFAGYSAIVNFTIDKIGQKDTNVEVKSAKINKSKATVKVGKTVSLSVTLKPENATDKTVTWASSNESIATVDSKGKVKALKAGTCTITATTSNGKKAKCKITVKK